MTHLVSRRRSAPLILGGATLLVLLVSLAANAAVLQTGSEGSGACNRNIAGAESLAFTLPDGDAVFERIPRLGISPELNGIPGPITVVLFEGAHEAVPVFPPLREGNQTTDPFVFENVVCVVTSTGEEHYYINVDRTGLNLDGLAVDRREN